MTDSQHPAQSHEFLSRLHDGDLPPAEADAFQAHRRSCDACRQAVDAYERTLSAFRAAPTAAPASDLAARILRKVRAQSPSRRPFGVMFGIDIRWAGVFATALIVVIIAASIVQERPGLQPAAPPKPAGPLPVHLVDGEAEGLARPVSPPQRAAAKDKEIDPFAPPADALVAEKDSPTLAASQEAGAASPPAAAPPPSEQAATRSTLSLQKTEAKAPAVGVRGQIANAEPPGGEAGASATPDRADALRLVVSALDSQGAAPPLETGVPDDRLALLRGREFILLVESQGRVRSVEPSPAREDRLRKNEPAAAADEETPDLDPLRELRFRPGDRPRRLLVRIE